MYKRARQDWTKHLDFILLDVFSLHLAFLLAYFIRLGFAASPYAVDPYRGLAVVMTIADLCVAILFRSMHNVLKRGYYVEVAQTIKHSVLVFGTLIVYMFSLKTSDDYSRIVLYIMLGFHMVFGFVIRVLWKKWLNRPSARREKHSLLIVADSANAPEIIAKLQSAPNEQYKISGIVLTDGNEREVAGVPVVCELSQAAKYICREWVDEVFFGVMPPSAETDKLVAQCREMGVVVHEALMLDERIGSRRFVEKVGGYEVLTSSVNYATPLQAAFKRLIDICGSLVGLLLTGFVILWVGPKIKKESPGPIFFSQERIGRNGKRFKFYKIRSMHMDAEKRKKELMAQNRVADGMMFKLDFDPRIIGNERLPDGTVKTGIGDFIRRTSLDELPQMWNILKGDMSLVGTRPPTVDEWEKYELHHRARLAIKPGLTGMWQISGRSGITDFEEVVKLDTQYIYNWSLGLDCRILLKTVKSVLGKDGAM